MSCVLPYQSEPNRTEKRAGKACSEQGRERGGFDVPNFREHRRSKACRLKIVAVGKKSECKKRKDFCVKQIQSRAGLMRS